MPFSREEVTQIMAACHQYSGGRGQWGRVNAQRLRALVQLLRFSGLRIRDAVTLSRERIVNGKLLLYTAKTGTPVHIPLPEFVVLEVEMSRSANPQFYFWSGEGKPKSCVGDWQRSLKKLFRLAGVPDGHAHRFRHTFCEQPVTCWSALRPCCYSAWPYQFQDHRETLRAMDPRPSGTTRGGCAESLGRPSCILGLN
jgi:integrase